ncbi:hypothetical protein ACFX2I_015433 [Malus domestica]
MKTTKGGKVMNPTDAYRKELRKKDLKRNKKERKKVRKVGILKKDPETLKEQIDKLELMKANGALDKARKHKKRQLEDTLNLVIKKQKILNIKSVDKSQKISQKFQDLSDFGEYISETLPMTIVDKTLFLVCFKIDGPACLLYYANFINVLINHPSLMSDFKRLEYFADIHQSKRHRTRPNDSHFHKVIKSLTFIDSKDWDTKIVEDGYLDEAKRHRETNKKKTYR